MGRSRTVWGGSPTSGQVPRTCARSRSRRRSLLTACPGTQGRRAASSSATSVVSSAASKYSRMQAPTTAAWRSASSRPTGSATGYGHSPARQPAIRNARRSSRRRRRRRSSLSRSTSSPLRSRSAYRRRTRNTMATAGPNSVSLGRARSASERFVNTPLFAILSRAGFVARALVYGIIGLLAFELVVGHGGKITNQQGALRTVEQRSFGHVLLALLAIGLGGYALWRLLRAFLGHGREGADKGIDRLGALGSGIVYALMCAVAVQILAGPGTSGGNTKKTASDVFGWPAGRWLVGAAGLVLAGVAVYQFIRGVRHKFLDDSKTEQMPRVVKTWFTILGTIG